MIGNLFLAHIEQVWFGAAGNFDTWWQYVRFALGQRSRCQSASGSRPARPSTC